jgi:hypothetical protein
MYPANSHLGKIHLTDSGIKMGPGESETDIIDEIDCPQCVDRWREEMRAGPKRTKPQRKPIQLLCYPDSE